MARQARAAGRYCAARSRDPCERLEPLVLMERGSPAAAFVAGVPAGVGLLELGCIGGALGWGGSQLHMHRLPAELGPGNAVLVTLEHEHVTERRAQYMCSEKRLPRWIGLGYNSPPLRRCLQNVNRIKVLGS